MKVLRGDLQGTSTVFNMALTQMTDTFNTQFIRGVEEAYGSARKDCPLSMMMLLQVSQ